MARDDILITGISGFIGSNLEKYIKKRYPYWNVYGIDKGLKQKNKKYKFDITIKYKLKELLFEIKPKYIFHLVGTNSTDDFKNSLLLNVYSTYILLQTIKEMKNFTPRVIIPSSASEYGEVFQSNLSIEENRELNPISIYGFSKMAQTKLSMMFVKDGLNIVIARIFNIIGDGIPMSLSIGKFAYELALIRRNKKPPILFTKNLQTKRDFIDIRDVCKYLLGIALNGKRGEVYNICSGRGYIIRDLIKRLIKISGIKEVKIIEGKSPHNDIKHSVGSTKKLNKLIRKFRLISIEESLKNTYNYYLSKV